MSPTGNFGYKEVNLQIIDMQEVGNNIFLVSKLWGIKDLNIEDKNNPTFSSYEFYHPYITNIYIHDNYRN